MLLEQFKNKKDEAKTQKQWFSFRYKNGHKDITLDNFLKLNYTYCKYRIEKRYYEGYFTKEEIDLIFEVLNYFEGKIIALAG